MAIYVYLSAKIKEAPGYEEREVSKGGKHWKEYSFLGRDLTQKDGEFYFIIHDIVADRVGAACLKYVVSATSIDFGPFPKRKYGQYFLGDAVATYSRDSGNGRLSIAASSLNTLIDLHNEFLAGKISPEVSHEEPQDCRSLQQLEGELSVANSLIAELRGDLDFIRATLENLRKNLLLGFPMVMTRGVIREISDMLASLR